MSNKNKLLVVYNTCGLSGRDNADYYIAALNTILAQNFDGFKVVMSDCMGNLNVRNKVVNYFNDQISYNFINEVLPVNVTFNHSILESIKKFGEFEGYLYVDSGVQFVRDNQLQQLYDLFKSGPYGMVSARVNDDSGVSAIFNLGKYEGDESEEYKLFEDGNFIVPIGKAVNLHCQIFSNIIQQYYNRCFSDIFASWCSESIFSFVCAAIKQKWVVSKDVKVHHDQGVDGQSSGFNPQIWRLQGNINIDHPFIVPSIIDIMKEGHKYGLGYEECQNVIIHDNSQYDKNGYCKNDQLKEYIKDNLFLSSQQLNYQTIKHQWIG